MPIENTNNAGTPATITAKSGVSAPISPALAAALATPAPIARGKAAKAARKAATVAKKAATVAATIERGKMLANLAPESHQRLGSDGAVHLAPASKPTTTAAKPAPKPATDTAPAPDNALARSVASIAVAAYYAGASLPFKSASDKFADLRLDKAPKAATQRQAACLAAMLACDTSGNIKANGRFVRGGFVLPARLFKPDAPVGSTVKCQPETGVLSDMLGRVIHYVSGPTSGKAQAETVLHLDVKLARAELALLGGAASKAALTVLDKLAA